MTPGATYTVRTSRKRTSVQGVYHQARYLGPDPERDGWLTFWWGEQGILLRVEEAVLDGEPTEAEPS